MRPTITRAELDSIAQALNIPTCEAEVLLSYGADILDQPIATDTEKAKITQALLDLIKHKDRTFLHLFQDPAWQLLLNMAHHAYSQGQMKSIYTKLIYAANLPPTTGGRYLKIMAARGLVTMTKEEHHDGRVTLVGLTDAGLKLMDEVISKFKGSLWSIR